MGNWLPMFPQTSENLDHNVMVWQLLNPFPHDKVLDQTKLKAFADDKLNVTKMIIPVFDRVENIVGKAISPFPTMFSIGFFPRGVKRCHCVGVG